MKVSIITVCYNSAATIATTLESVRDQDYPHIEHIIVDGKSTDHTMEIVSAFDHVAKAVSEKDEGLYDAINKGMKLATGDVVGILNSDDFFPHRGIISRIAKAFSDADVDAVYGDVAFVRPDNLSKIVRYYSAKRFHPGKFKYGYMPPHPSFYAKRSCFEKYGLYKPDYVIASDYELLMRFLYRFKVPALYINEALVYMRTGGVSNKNVLSRYVLNKEIIRACKENFVDTNMAILSVKYFNKVFEYVRPLLGNGSKN